MTYTEFFKRLQEVYGEYANNTIKLELLTYVKKNINEKNLPEIYQHLRYEYSNSYRKSPPDIADIRKVLKDHMPSVPRYNEVLFLEENISEEERNKNLRILEEMKTKLAKKAGR